MKDYYALQVNNANDIVFFDTAGKLLIELEERNLPARKCTFKKVLDVERSGNAQNYMQTHETVDLSYEEIKRLTIH